MAAAKKSGKKSDADEFMAKVRADWSSTEQANKLNVERGVDALKFKAGEHYTADEKKERANNGLVSLTVNKVPQFVRQVTGDVRLNKPAIKVRPVDDAADPQMAEVLSGLIRNIENVSRAQSIYATAADNSVTCGQGAWRINKKYVSEDSFDQELCIEPIPNALSVYFDPLAQRVDRSDASFCFVVSRLKRSVYEAKYPNSAATDFSLADYPEAEQSSIGSWITEDTIRIAEYWCVKTEPREIALLSNGTVADVADFPNGVETWAAQNGLSVKGKRKADRRKVYQYIVNGVEVLEGPIEWDGPNIPIIVAVGEETWIGDDCVRLGLVHGVRDSQRLYNYTRSTSAMVQSSQPKAPWLVTPKQLAGFETIWADAGKGNFPYLPYNVDPDAPGAPQRSAPPMIASGLIQEAQLASDDMKAATGIYDASLGARSNETSAVAIEARDRAGDVSNFVYIDNLSIAIAYTGQQLVDLIPRVYDTERVVRILGDDGKDSRVTVNKTVAGPDGQPMIENDLSVGKYDVVCEVGPSFSTKRREASTSMVEFIRAFPAAAPILGDVLAQVQDWPKADEIAQRMQALLPPQLSGQPQEQGPPVDPNKIAQAEYTKAKTDSQAMDNFAKAQALGIGAPNPAAMAGAPLEPEPGGFLG